MRAHPWRVPLLLSLVVLAVAVAGCSSPKTTPQDAGESTPTVTLEDLKGQSLADQQEGLIFQYLELGGVSALESRFGKPSATYETHADDASTGGICELPDGRAWLFQVGYDSGGKAIVMAHSVEGTTGMTLSNADKAFISTIKDGKTTLDEVNKYIGGIAGADFEPVVPDPKGIKVPALVWNLEDGSGFIVVDLSSLSAEQLADLGFEDMGPYQAMWWDASHWRAYPEGDEAQ